VTKSSAGSARTVEVPYSGTDIGTFERAQSPVDPRGISSPTSLSSSDPLRVTEYCSWASLAEVMPAWKDILDANPALSIFSTPEWLFSWWQAFARHHHLRVLVLSDASGRVVGIFPLYWEEVKRPPLRFAKHFRLVGDGTMDSDNLGPILRPGFEAACIASFLTWMSNEPDCGICSFNTVPAASTSLAVLKDKLKASNWPAWETATPNCAIPLPSDWDTYINGISSKFRRLIARSQRRLAQQYQVRLRRCEKVLELAPMLEDLFSLHQKRWTSIQQPGTFSCPERRQFYVEMAAAFFNKGWLELWSLELDGRATAAQLSFRYRNTVYGLQEGFDPAYSIDHVGYVLRAAMLEEFIRGGVTRYDFLGGTSANKLRWGAEEGIYTNLAFAAPWTLGSCYLNVGKRAAAGKEWLRHHLPKPAWNVLHRAKVSLLDEEAVPQPAALDALDPRTQD